MPSKKDRKPPIEGLEYLINHVFLPPKVPQEDDYNSDHEKLLLKVVLDALTIFKRHVPTEWLSTIDLVIDMVQNIKSMLDDKGFMNEEGLRESLQGLSVTGGTLLLHIREQNCGVMMTKVDESVQIEAFELLPQNQSVFATNGRLRRSFPGPALSMTVKDFKVSDFQEAIAETLAKMSHQSAPGTKPKVKKAGYLHDEDRDTTHPKMVTELFFNFLRPLCEQVDLLRIQKNTRDEVMWSNSRLPWHRSSLWLLLRVGIQLVFSRNPIRNQKTNNTYKLFMVHMLSNVLDMSRAANLPGELFHIMQAKIARRLLKLDSDDSEVDLNPVANVVHAVTESLTTRWARIQKRAELNCDLSRLKQLQFSDDSIHILQALNEHIEKLSMREHGNREDLFDLQLGLVMFQNDLLPDITHISGSEYIVFNIQAFERWIDSNLNKWTTRHQSKLETCGELGKLIHAYHNVAAPIYREDPVDAEAQTG
ncbi:hypothetical protein BBP40_000732 [Aspergillus hancockii]|nr:hypothetical protein BBP40_000732 [Aspergillus hancockii]